MTCLSGCISGPVNEWLLAGDEDKARETLAELRDIYGQEHTWVEIHNHGLEPQQRVTPACSDSRKTSTFARSRRTMSISSTARTTRPTT